MRIATDEASVVNNRDIPDICLQYMLAVMLIDKTASFRAAHDNARMQDPAVLRERAKIQLVPDAELEKLLPKRVAIVEVTFTDGTRLSERVDAVRGTARKPHEPGRGRGQSARLDGSDPRRGHQRQSHRQSPRARERERHSRAAPASATHVMESCDVLVVGGGNAGLSAAIAAREAGASVMLLEHAPKAFRGGNSRHTRNLRLMHNPPPRPSPAAIRVPIIGATCSA